MFHDIIYCIYSSGAAIWDSNHSNKTFTHEPID